MDQQVEQVNVDVKKIAYKKAMLHACKYVTEDVIGILIGSIDGSNVNIIDAYPLFHSRASLNVFEAALDIIQSELKNQDKIIGIYEARVHQHGAMSEIAQELLQTMNNKSAVLMRITQIDNEDTQILNAKIISLNENVKYVINTQSRLEWNVIEECVKQGQHWKIIDFDAHFENLKLDFRNQYLE